MNRNFQIYLVFGFLMAALTVCLIALSNTTSQAQLAPRCQLAEEARLDWHPLTPDYIGRLVAQQLMDDGIAIDQVPPKYELQHAAKIVSDECL